MTDHGHTFAFLAHITHAPISETDPIAHTAFVLMRCPCGAITGFPEHNFALITPRYRARLEYIAMAPGGHHIFATPSSQVLTAAERTSLIDLAVWCVDFFHDSDTERWGKQAGQTLLTLLNATADEIRVAAEGE